MLKINKYMCAKLYDLPQYYDIAFSWDITQEIELFRKIFEKHVPFKVKEILEPACGTGRFMLNLPKYGYNITGYDNNPNMIMFVKRRIIEAGLQTKANVKTADMRRTQFKTKFDAAINSINSVGYLTADNDIIMHFRNTGNSLREGGVYVIHLACAWDKLPTHVNEGWILERHGVRVKTIWSIKKEDYKEKLCHQICILEIDDKGKRFVVKDEHIMRLWIYDDLKDLINKSRKFRLESIYDEKNRRVPLDAHVSGEMGNLYYVLKHIVQKK